MVTYQQGRQTRRTYDRQWERLARRFLAMHPHCSMPGCDKASQHVDHEISVKRAPHLRLAWTNLRAYCAHHHDVVTNAFDMGRIAGACDEDGNPLDPSHPWAMATTRQAIDTVNRPPAPAPDTLLSELKMDRTRGRSRSRSKPKA